MIVVGAVAVLELDEISRVHMRSWRASAREMSGLYSGPSLYRETRNRKTGKGRGALRGPGPVACARRRRAQKKSGRVRATPAGRERAPESVPLHQPGIHPESRSILARLGARVNDRANDSDRPEIAQAEIFMRGDFGTQPRGATIPGADPGGSRRPTHPGGEVEMKNPASFLLAGILILLAAAAGAQPTPAEDGVRFSFRAPGASRVNLAGEMNAWSTSATPMTQESGDLWSVVVPLAPGVYRYKFVVDGNAWKEDPNNPTKVDDNYGGFNSLLVVKSDGTLSFNEDDREIRIGDDYPTEKGTLYLNLIWHQHQPLYLDPEKDELQGPWVRAHGTKDYYDMA
ncbi:MAG: hypothetical protein EHM19_10660, partial [Candidatus Latescibacterota bacterium]